MFSLQVPFSHSLKLEAACREADARYANLQESPHHRCLLRAPLLSSKADGPPKGPPKRDKEMQKNRVQTWWIPNADHNDVEHRTGVSAKQQNVNCRPLLRRSPRATVQSCDRSDRCFGVGGYIGIAGHVDCQVASFS